MREYAVDPLEATFVREVMDTDVFTVEPSRQLEDLYGALGEGSAERRQRLYPVLDAKEELTGILPWSAVLTAKDRPGQLVADVMIAPIALAYPDEILRSIADRMAAYGIGVIPVVERSDAKVICGLITQFDLLAARQKLLEEERHAERVLTLRRVGPRRLDPDTPTDPVPTPEGMTDESTS